MKKKGSSIPTSLEPSHAASHAAPPIGICIALLGLSLAANAYFLHNHLTISARQSLAQPVAHKSLPDKRGESEGIVTLRELLSPVKEKTFWTEHFQNRWVHIRGDDEDSVSAKQRLLKGLWSQKVNFRLFYEFKW